MCCPPHPRCVLVIHHYDPAKIYNTATATSGGLTIALHVLFKTLKPHEACSGRHSRRKTIYNPAEVAIPSNYVPVQSVNAILIMNNYRHMTTCCQTHGSLTLPYPRQSPMDGSGRFHSRKATHENIHQYWDRARDNTETNNNLESFKQNKELDLFWVKDEICRNKWIGNG